MLSDKTVEMCEMQALESFLSYFPMDKSYGEILQMISDESDEVLIWEPFEYHDAEFIIETIENEKSSLIAFSKLILETT